MITPFDEVAPTTTCPSVLGGRRRHYPRTISNRPVTMPYLSMPPLGQHRIVMLSLCANDYLVPPAANETGPTQPVCEDCKELLAENQAEDTPRRLSADTFISTSA